MAAKAITLVCLLLLSFSASVPFVAGDELSFLALGDWGGIELWPYTTLIERAVSKGMSKIAENLETQFIVALGDNFYHLGVKNVDDKRFNETFEDVFTAKSLMTPWYFCAGNHDHYGNVSAQIAYSSKSKRWNFPDYYYTKSWKIPGSDIELQLVLLDTVQLCGDSGDDHFNTQPQEPESQEASETQWKWIEDTLQSSTAHYLIVGGHFPVWSVAEHGPTDCLVNRLRPLLQKYKVTAYISGHDHNLQHLKESNSSVEYFVIGSAAYIVDSKTHKDSVPKGSLSFFWADADKEGGFAAVRVAATNMTLEFVDAFGASLYKRQLYPRNIHLNFK
ncbi:tartrate-resistant acid phosphatase type 5-like [Porites lutea]|uniref:tartrate-resistant acid phosphatase type 5-like n=1 Tax=Porites lutea TaxID=51062 RepID=UPI003CC6D99B